MGYFILYVSCPWGSFLVVLWVALAIVLVLNKEVVVMRIKMSSGRTVSYDELIESQRSSRVRLNQDIPRAMDAGDVAEVDRLLAVEHAAQHEYPVFG